MLLFAASWNVVPCIESSVFVTRLCIDFSHLLPRSARASMAGTGESAGPSVNLHGDSYRGAPW